MFRTFIALSLLLLAGPLTTQAQKVYSGKPVKILVITGGCCHNYPLQTSSLTNAFQALADAEWTIVNEGGKGTRAMIPLYDNPQWAAPYDVVMHNECFADTDDPAYVKKILTPHQQGKPAVVIHCAMHSYRALKTDDWREFLGVTSRHHEALAKYPVKVVETDHPATRDFPANYVTQWDELYVIEKLWPKAKALAVTRSPKDQKDHPVIWVNDYHGTRVFGTTYGHSDDTFKDPVYLKMVSMGALWAAGKIK